MKTILPVITLAVQFALAIMVAVVGAIAVAILEEKRERDGLDFPHR